MEDYALFIKIFFLRMALYFDTVCHTGFGYVRGSRSGKIKYVFFFFCKRQNYVYKFFFSIWKNKR
jgi:hypothetical protein